MAMGGRVATVAVLMKCDSCQEKATVFYTQVTDGKLKKFSLCESCADAKGITDPNGLVMPEELLSNQPSGDPAGELFSPSRNRECPSCGFTLDDFRKIGRLGCAQCYATFKDEIEPRLPSLHKGNRHTGYLPEGLQTRQELESKLADLTARLDTAILEERFEEAASLRDEIEELKSPEKGASS